MIRQQYLHQLFTRLACSPIKKADIPVTELGNIPLEFIQLLEKESVLKKLNSATAITCNQCELACNEEIHYHPHSKQPYIDCSNTGRINMNPQQLWLWELSFGNLAKKTALLCGCSGQEQQKKDNWYIGQYNADDTVLVTLELHISTEHEIELLINKHPVPLAQLFTFEDKTLKMNHQLLSSLSIQYVISDPDTPINYKREKRKYKTQKLYQQMNQLYLEYKKNHEGKSDIWIANKVRKDILNITGKDYSNEYVRTRMKIYSKTK